MLCAKPLCEDCWIRPICLRGRENILLPSHWSCSSSHEEAWAFQSVSPCITHEYKHDPDHAVSTCQHFYPIKLARVHDTEAGCVLLSQLGSECAQPDGPWYGLKPLTAKLAWINPNLLDILALDQCSVPCDHAVWPTLTHLIKDCSHNF